MSLFTNRRVLYELAKRLNISITEEYAEIKSGERISSRPEMQRLLDDVDAGRWKGVLVMEVERLARGDTKDQGVVAEAFKYSNTLIITPTKIYDPSDPNDEEYFEFGLFMSRMEYKTITRRLQWGRDQAVREGRFTGNIAPYGYVRVKLPNKAKEDLEQEKNRIQARVDVIPRVEHVIKVYPRTKNPALKNDLLREVLEKITYRKEKGGRWDHTSLDAFTITLYPKLPK